MSFNCPLQSLPPPSRHPLYFHSLTWPSPSLPSSPLRQSPSYLNPLLRSQSGRRAYYHHSVLCSSCPNHSRVRPGTVGMLLSLKPPVSIPSIPATLGRSQTGHLRRHPRSSRTCTTVEMDQDGVLDQRRKRGLCSFMCTSTHVVFISRVGIYVVVPLSDPPDLDPSAYFDFALFDMDMSMSPLQEIAFLPQLNATPSLESVPNQAPLALPPPFNNIDAEGDTDTDATDVESPPSPYVDTRRKRRYLPYDVFSPSRTSRCHSSASFPASTSTRRSRVCRRREPPNRNIQATLTPAQIESAIRSRTFTCPAEKCTFVQKKRRVQDFVRHMESHNAKRWVCCGVPITKARKYGITDISGAYEYEGVSLVGGCLHRFSRADAYKRHLDNEKCPCVGSVEFARNFVEKSNS